MDPEFLFFVVCFRKVSTIRGFLLIFEVYDLYKKQRAVEGVILPSLYQTDLAAPSCRSCLVFVEKCSGT